MEHKHRHEHDHEPACATCEAGAGSVQLGKKLKTVGLIFLIILAASFHPILTPLNKSLIGFIKVIWWAVLLGLLIGGLIDHFVPDDFIFKYLGGKRKRNLFFAVIAGFLLSACSHGILAIAMQLHKKGASIPAVITFLLATPWANLPVTILLFGFFGWKAFLFILAAMIIALITGGIFILLEKVGWIEQSKHIDFKPDYQWTAIKKFSLKKAIKGTFRGAVSLANMVLWWILIGFLLAAVIGAYVPGHIFMNYFGPDIWGLLLTLAFATVIEVCSEGSAPIAFEIFSKVGTLGNPFIFLMAGVATDYTEIGLLWTNIGKRTALWLPVITVPQIVAVALLFNWFL
ncbi:permease [Patescibacteria group bacterium]|nr:permease [Patescibacteria group bacterium]